MEKTMADKILNTPFNFDVNVGNDVVDDRVSTNKCTLLIT